MSLNYGKSLCCLMLTAPMVASANDLLDTFHLAQTQDQTLLAAQYQRDAAIEAHPQALSTLLPQLSATGQGERERTHDLTASTSTGAPAGAYYYNQDSYSLNLSQTIFDWTAFQTLSQSNKQVAQAQATFEYARQDLIYRTADAYFTVLNAQDTLKADVDAQTAYQQQLEQAQKKFQVGLAAITDVRNAQASYDTSRATVIADQRALDSAKRSLGQLIGRPVASAAGLQDEIPLVAPTPTAEEDWVKAALQDNPNLMNYYYAQEAAKKNIDALQGKYLPTLSAVGAVGRQKTDSDISGDEVNDSIGLQLNYNIFQGGLVHSQIKQAAASWHQAQAQYEGQRRVVDQAARDAYEGVISGIAGVQANHQAVISNQTSLEASQVGLKVGTRTEVDVLTAQQALAAAERSYYQSRYDYLRSVLSLKQQAGRLNEPDLIEIDNLLVKK